VIEFNDMYASNIIINSLSYYMSYSKVIRNDLKLKTNNCLWPLGIYKGIFG